MARLNYEQLRAFLMVVRTGGVVKAARALHLTQPAITARIKNLEDSLRADLFERTSSGLVLTKRGELLVRHAERLELLANLIQKDVMDPAGIDGYLRIGASETIAQCWLPDLITELHRTFPKLEIEFNVDVSVNLREALLNREVDLAILLGPVSDFSVDNIDLPAFDLAWYCAPALLHGTKDAAQLFAKPVITYSSRTRPFRELKELLFERIGPDVSLFPSSSLSASFRLVEAGLGVAALPRRVGQAYVAKGTVAEFDPGWRPGPLRFSASFMAEPRSHVVEMAARLAERIAISFAEYK